MGSVYCQRPQIAVCFRARACPSWLWAGNTLNRSPVDCRNKYADNHSHWQPLFPSKPVNLTTRPSDGERQTEQRRAGRQVGSNPGPPPCETTLTTVQFVALASFCAPLCFSLCDIYKHQKLSETLGLFEHCVTRPNSAGAGCMQLDGSGGRLRTDHAALLGEGGPGPCEIQHPKVQLC